MNKALGTVLLTLIGVAAFAAPTITGVTAQQRYPWNGKVDISYTVTGDIARRRSRERCLLRPGNSPRTTEASTTRWNAISAES